ncbi:MAG: hypothetical protein GX069_09975 [Tissierellia bacterium]|nr:hypothetical protein [Tissierellia bacterium]
MFPRGLLIFIIILAIDIITKSIKDKKKIEESRKKRSESLSKGKNLEKNIFEEKLPEYMVEVKSEVSKFSSNIVDKEVVEEIKEVNEEKVKDILIKDRDNISNRKSRKNRIKKDILRGIIFSEILSEPKSLRNVKRSI